MNLLYKLSLTQKICSFLVKVVNTVGQDNKKYYDDCRRLGSYKVVNYARKFNTA